jgi:hypothetical protein
MTTRIPILQLTRRPVTLWASTKDARGVRWTLGPTWYDIHQDDDSEEEPYLNLGPLVEASENDDECTMHAARQWAIRRIADTTNYRVTGWEPDRLTPILVERQDVLSIDCVDEHCGSFTVPSMTRAYGILCTLREPDAVITIKVGRKHNEDTGSDTEITAYIPVRNVTHIRHIVTNTPIKNEA